MSKFLSALSFLFSFEYGINKQNVDHNKNDEKHNTMWNDVTTKRKHTKDNSSFKEKLVYLVLGDSYTVPSDKKS